MNRPKFPTLLISMTILVPLVATIAGLFTSYPASVGLVSLVFAIVSSALVWRSYESSLEIHKLRLRIRK